MAKQIKRKSSKARPSKQRGRTGPTQSELWDQIRLKVATVFASIPAIKRRPLDRVEPAEFDAISAALVTGLSPKVAYDIAFHLTDWHFEAAFLLAVTWFPERFTQEEMRCNITGFVIHAPNHVAAAAKLAGWPIQDVFGVGAVEKASSD